MTKNIVKEGVLPEGGGKLSKSIEFIFDKHKVGQENIYFDKRVNFSQLKVDPQKNTSNVGSGH